MAADGYQIVFDLTTASDRWWPGILGPMAAMLTIGIVILLLPDRFLRRLPFTVLTGVARKVWAVCYLMIIGAVIIVAVPFHFRETAVLTSLERQQKLAVIEGCLQSFHPMPETGHEEERLRVGGRKFSYSDFDESSPGFNNTESHGGPVHADSAVKIWYVENNIVRLGVRQRACPHAPDLRDS